MRIKRTQITSSSDPNNTHPWFEFDINENARSIVTLEVSDDRDAEGPDISGLKADLAQNQNLDNELVIGHTTKGLEAWQFGDNPSGDIISHLAYWHPDTDTLEVLDFVE